MLCAVVLTQYWHVTDWRTDRQTDGIAIASTALAMQALRLAVESSKKFKKGISFVFTLVELHCFTIQ